MEQWDEEEKQRKYDIEFKGDHIHEMENNHCKVCGKTRLELMNYKSLLD